ncbi:acyl-CoA dehydrogenase [Cellulomonas sp. zg-ZUI222]|uniref:acyl-CoA dehydrogenase n=1 Tax=Cellulomonas TaxID=1707 RepID=UPI001A93C3BE|nr:MULTISPECIES: acyl-CoA dehydrogenase [Cellulomonas]MBO0901443.1 acyl-CoA dehydrogenase [Cellulomonas sp. zg-ZUI22]MBO0921889.1 acyl-CoA dehydrogenase [Cellulomonas wangleii]
MPRTTPPVQIGPSAPWLPADLPTDVDDALTDVRTWPADLRPGHGATARLWSLLASLAAHDLGVARAVEPHLDALAILDQAGAADTTGRTWGVFAAEGPGVRLDAFPPDAGGTWRLRGTKPWCSLAGRLDAALVTAHLPDGARALFAVDLRDPGVAPVDQPWASRGLVEIPSTPVAFDDVPAAPVGAPGWYLERPGFWWGGIGVAACWYGGAVALARALWARASTSDDRLVAMHLGAVDVALQDARRALEEAARVVDGEGGRVPGPVVAKRARATVARTCEDVLTRVGHALGPAPLALDPVHAKRVADLQVYVRQHHAERDDASLGAALGGTDTAPW